MTKKVGSTPKPLSATSAKKAAKKAAKPARAKAFGKVKTAAKQSFPRTTWQDTNKLGNELGKAEKAGSKHPRILHAESNATQGANHKPPIQMKYGGPRPPAHPPIQARYGLPTPNPAKPPIQMKYGGPRPPNKPPIQMKYGGPRPPNKPPIQMKYGGPRPAPDQTKKV